MLLIRSIKRDAFLCLMLSLASSPSFPSLQKSPRPTSTQEGTAVPIIAPTPELDSIIKALQARQYSQALQLHNQYPETLCKLKRPKHDTTYVPLRQHQRSVTNNQPITSYKEIVALITAQKNVCSFVEVSTLRKLYDIIKQTPHDHIDFLKNLMEFLRTQKKPSIHHTFLCSMVANQNLPLDELMHDFPFKQELGSQARTEDYTHRAITRLQDVPFITLNPKEIVPEDEQILSFVLYYCDSSQCLQNVKLALWAGAMLSQDTMDYAEYYNPSCLLFLQQYQAWFPQYHSRQITRDNYKNVLTAFMKWMLQDNPNDLINYLKPHDKGPIDPTTKEFRSCFIGSLCSITNEYCSYFQKANRTRLYQELLPILKQQKTNDSSYDNSHDNSCDDLFVHAIINTTKETDQLDRINNMLEQYDPNHYYLGDAYPEYYGTPPLFIAIAEHESQATHAILTHIKKQTRFPLRPAWQEFCNPEIFALFTCFRQYQWYISSSVEINIAKNLLPNIPDEQAPAHENETTQEITENDMQWHDHARFKIHVKKYSIPDNPECLIQLQSKFDKSLATLKAVLQHTDLAQPEPNNIPPVTTEQFLLKKTIKHLTEIDIQISKQFAQQVKQLPTHQASATQTSTQIPQLYGTEILEALFESGASPHTLIENVSLDDFARCCGDNELALYLAKYKESHPKKN